MDKTYVEELIHKKTDTKEIAIRVAVIVLSLFATYMVFAFLGAYKIPAIYGVVFLIVPVALIGYTFSATSVEYEYLLVQNTLTIDGIYGKNKRKNLYQLEVTKCEAIVPVKSIAEDKKTGNPNMKCIDFTSGQPQNPVYYLVVPYGGANTRVYIEVSEKMLEGLKMAAPSKVKKFI